MWLRSRLQLGVSPLDTAEAFLRDQVPITGRAVIPTTLKAAYSAAHAVIQDEPILNVTSARDNRGRIIQWAVDLAFERLVRGGQWAQGSRWRHYERPTGRYLEIQMSHSVLTISQVADPRKQPRDVRFRRTKRLASQMVMPGILRDDDRQKAGVPHVLLMHGHQALTFAYLAIPDPDHHRGFQHRSSNLMLMVHEVPAAPEPPMEPTDYELVLTLKEEIEKWRRDHGND
jgi:hypothetical protein